MGRTPDWSWRHKLLASPHQRVDRSECGRRRPEGGRHGERCDCTELGQHPDRALPESRGQLVAALRARATRAVHRSRRAGCAPARTRGRIGRARSIRPRHGRSGRVAVVDPRAPRLSLHSPRAARLGAELSDRVLGAGLRRARRAGPARRTRRARARMGAHRRRIDRQRVGAAPCYAAPLPGPTGRPAGRRADRVRSPRS